MNIIDLAKLISAIIFVLILPGLIWSFIFFPSNTVLREHFGTVWVNLLERVVLSIALSFAIISFLLVMINYFFNLDISPLAVLIIVLFISALGIFVNILMRTEMLKWFSVQVIKIKELKYRFCDYLRRRYK